MDREAIRVEPFSTYLERRRKGPIFPVVAAGGFVFVSGLPPFDPATGEATRRPFREQAQIVLDQMKRCLEAAGSSLERVVKCNIYCTEAARFDEFPRDKFSGDEASETFRHPGEKFKADRIQFTLEHGRQVTFQRAILDVGSEAVNHNLHADEE